MRRLFGRDCLQFSPNQDRVNSFASASSSSSSFSSPSSYNNPDNVRAAKLIINYSVMQYWSSALGSHVFAKEDKV